ncbi:MAG: hypothetical protein ACLUSL_09950 [Ruminococcus sp.]
MLAVKRGGGEGTSGSSGSRERLAEKDFQRIGLEFRIQNLGVADALGEQDPFVIGRHRIFPFSFPAERAPEKYWCADASHPCGRAAPCYYTTSEWKLLLFSPNSHENFSGKAKTAENPVKRLQIVVEIPVKF